MAKKNKEKKVKSRVEASRELTPDTKKCSNGNCASEGPCNTDNCR